MSESVKKKSVLFVDDDAAFVATIRELFDQMSRGSWEILTAPNHSQALALLTKRPVDLAVVDINLPVMDGVQFLQLLGRTHPDQQVAILTGEPSEERRRTCLESGAVLFLEKPASSQGYEAVYAALDAVISAPLQGGFHGMMRRVGLQEVLQLECLGRKSSVLEIFTGKVRGRIYTCDGSIVHAVSGTLQGEVALFGLLALRGGEFNLLPYSEPQRRTVSGHWESLLMEAARLTDEGQMLLDPSTSTGDEEQAAAPSVQVVGESAAGEPVIQEVVLCSGAGEVLYDWASKSLELRLRLLDQVEQQAAQLASLASLGRFDRLEVLTAEERVVCQIQPDRRLFVRRSGATLRLE